LAYVDFEDEAAAAHALLKTDNLDIEGKVISVAISRPPERKQTSLLDEVASLGGRPREPRRGGLMPRAVRLAMPPATAPTNGAAAPAAKKSNNDFRALLLAKK